MNISFIFQNRSPSALVWYTSRRVTFIKLSQSTRWPLKVTPFLSSTSCCAKGEREESDVALGQLIQYARRMVVKIGQMDVADM